MLLPVLALSYPAVHIIGIESQQPSSFSTTVAVVGKQAHSVGFKLLCVTLGSGCIHWTPYFLLDPSYEVDKLLFHRCIKLLSCKYQPYPNYRYLQAVEQVAFSAYDSGRSDAYRMRYLQWMEKK